MATQDKIAVVGSGLIGRAWAIVFARAGMDVTLWDQFPQQTTQAMAFIADRLPELQANGLLSEEPATVLARIKPMPSLWDAVHAATHIQENGPERVEIKTAVFAELERAAQPHATIASSSSGIPASAFTEGLRTRERCLIAHPVNPPYLVPLVELCPAPWTDPAAVAATRALMERAGQVPATVKKEVDGFALNRLQGALLAEAFRLLADDVISPADLDALVKHGLGLRWSFMGPLETIDLNAPGGLADYCNRYGPLYAKMQEQMKPLDWDSALVDRLHDARRTELPANMQAVRQEWRDRRLMALLAHKASQPD
ncbi:MAG TPA: 3-hydroxyacyl-CoA dehydrogenase [Rhodopila sp.]|uniref:3-hydroxyacyl-CoA dehydrogenase n=1 Tax=Rhodopila sp. TaxID=2480087 RepID=UPI002BCD38C6|nr:3-hydroxyacyl-CoA dehydrogenase [Rhodopila sp.]HVY16776.1 3-hydroxyacyl-CoA dehydrogenase [Rhodopila sp.]